jgi:hypothetical protein
MCNSLSVKPADRRHVPVVTPSMLARICEMLASVHRATSKKNSQLAVVNIMAMSSRMMCSVRFISRVVAGILLIALSLNGQSAAPKLLVLTLWRYGFEPSQATIKAGDIVLIVENRSGKPAPTFRISSSQSLSVTAQGQTQVDVPSLGKSMRSGQLLRLSPGSYTVTETAEPKWVFQLTVQ